ncbi:MAG: prolyl oligopeptidase family serine peptidase [Planctomycetaceae bacterium]
MSFSPLQLIIGMVVMFSALVLTRNLQADEEYEARKFRAKDDIELNYRWLQPKGYVPGEKSDTKYPLVIFLHGAGERGDDNAAQLRHCTSRFTEADVREKFPCFVMAPQCPTGKRWVEVDWSKGQHDMPKTPSEPMARVLELLDQLIKTHAIDEDRIYVMGLSMGGYGTWDLLARHPEKFAAGVPICGGGDEKQAAKIKDIPIWVFHGDADTAVKVERSRNMVAAIKEAGGQPKYTEYPGVGHNSWTPAINEPGILPWLFSQKRAAAK